MTSAAPKLMTAADLIALGDARAEVIAGVITYKADPSAEHSDAQGGALNFLRERFHRRPGGNWPGGWWILPEVDIELSRHEVFRPDLAGWRRERVPERPTGRPVTIRPDWICEVLSPSNAATDLVDKFRVYASSGVPFYWFADPERRILVCHRLEGGEYKVVAQGKAGETVNAPPFDAVPLRVGILFGEDPE